MKFIITIILSITVVLSACLVTHEFDTACGLLAASVSSSGNNVPRTPADDFTYNVIKELTSAPYMGRLPGTPGNKMAVSFISERYKDLGLKQPPGYNSYLQTFQQQLIVQNSATVLVTRRKTGEVTGEYNHLSDYIGLPLWPNTKIQGLIDAPLVSITDLKQLSRNNQEIYGKVLLISSELVHSLPHDHLQADGIVNKLLSLGSRIEGSIINFDNRRDGYFHVSKSMKRLFRGSKKYNNKNGQVLLYCSDAAYPYLKEAAEREDNVYISVDFSLEECYSSNVIGVIEGTDRSNNDHIIIAAHLDHIGDNKDETYNPGALDNASGIAGLLEIARTLLNKTELPQKDIIFIATNGEEEYFAGSNYYVGHPILPLKNATMINLDMIGAKGAEYLEVCYPGNNSVELSRQIASDGLEIGINTRSSYILSSDHVTFSVCGVPAVMLKHLQPVQRHHTMQDSFEITMDINKLQEAIDLVVYYIEQTAY